MVFPCLAFQQPVAHSLTHLTTSTLLHHKLPYRPSSCYSCFVFFRNLRPGAGPGLPVYMVGHTLHIERVTVCVLFIYFNRNTYTCVYIYIHIYIYTLYASIIYTLYTNYYIYIYVQYVPVHTHVCVCVRVRIEIERERGKS